MTKVIRIIASFFLCLALATGASVADQTTNKPPLSRDAGVVKDTAGMDTLIASLQGGGMVKVALSSTPLRSGADNKPQFQPSLQQVSKNGSEEAAEVDVRMLIAALVLVGVIALRRIN